MVPRRLRWLRHQLARQRKALAEAKKRRDKRRSPVGKAPRKKQTKYQQLVIECPAVLDFDDEPEMTAAFFSRLDAVLSGVAMSVLVDHRPLGKLSPGAALVLIAHLYRASRVKRGIRLQAHLPLATAPRDMLGEIGYYKYYRAHIWKRPAPSQRFFLEHKKAEMVDTEFAEKLCEHWLAAQDARSTQRLYAAIVEGMANATEWAYAECADGYRSWWMLGYRDTQTGEIAYSLYDQGLGITGTIRRKNSFLEILPGLRPTDPELIQQAVVDGRYSRTRQKGRGTGLPTLLEFVREGTDGELLIFSKNCRCVFRHAQGNLLNEYTIALRGTLISWSFRP